MEIKKEFEDRITGEVFKEVEKEIDIMKEQLKRQMGNKMVEILYKAKDEGSDNGIQHNLKEEFREIAGQKSTPKENNETERKDSECRYEGNPIIEECKREVISRNLNLKDSATFKSFFSEPTSNKYLKNLIESIFGEDLKSVKVLSSPDDDEFDPLYKYLRVEVQRLNGQVSYVAVGL
ncbi:MAG: hypothetical protein Q4G05_03455 [Clostridia bacterium]|nr:hypothetical protein [Clostridia bacterium]